MYPTDNQQTDRSEGRYFHVEGLKSGSLSATIMVTLVPGKNRQCILNLGGNSEKERISA